MQSVVASPQNPEHRTKGGPMTNHTAREVGLVGGVFVLIGVVAVFVLPDHGGFWRSTMLSVAGVVVASAGVAWLRRRRGDLTSSA